GRAVRASDEPVRRDVRRSGQRTPGKDGPGPRSGPGQVLVVRPERLRLADAGVPGVVRERRYTGAAAFYLVETEPGDRVEVLARPEAARVGDRVYLEAVRVLTFPEEHA